MVASAQSPQPSPNDLPSPGKSTGPRTDAGKARSAMNALTHGLTAKTPLLPGEDPEAFKAFVWDVVLDLDPSGPVQRELAHRVALLMWKRRRVNEAERQAFCNLQAEYHEETEDQLQEKEEFAETPEDFKAVEEARRWDAEHGRERDAGCMLADELGAKPGALDRLARHEQRLDRQIDSTLRLLLRLQNRDPHSQRGREDEGREEVKDESEAPSDVPSDVPYEASASPSPAPAQNELSAPERDSQQSASPGPWTGPPGVN
jgi:hypothetical protein